MNGSEPFTGPDPTSSSTSALIPADRSHGDADALRRRHATSPTTLADHLSYEERQSQEHVSASPINGKDVDPPTSRQPDFGSESAFPSLGAPSTAPKTSGGWGSGPALSARLNMAAVASAAQPKKMTASARVAGPHQGPKSQVQSGPMHTETLVLQTKSVSIGPTPQQYRERGPRAAGEKREEDPKTIPEVIRAVQRRHPAVYIESSTSRETVSVLFRTPLTLPSRSPGASSTPEERIAPARAELVARVSRKTSLSLEVPHRVRAAIIGPKGKNLKQIIDATGADIRIVRRDSPDGSQPEAALATVTPPNGVIDNGAEDEAPDVVTISGGTASVQAARDQITAIVEERMSRLTQRITSIPLEDYPLLNGAKGSKMTELVRAVAGRSDDDDDEESPDVVVHVPPFHPRYSASVIAVSGGDLQDLGRPLGHDGGPKKDDAIVVTGHRDLVAKVVSAIESAHEELKRTTRPFEIQLPKRQHRLIVQAIEEVLDTTGSLVEVPSATDPSEKIVIRGEQMANVQALQLVLEKANAMSIDTIDLGAIHKATSDAHAYSLHATRYLLARGKLRAIQDSHPTVKVYLPRPSSSGTGTSAGGVEIIGKSKDDVKTVRTAILAILQSLPPDGFAVASLDPLVHRHLIGKKGSKIKAFRDAKGVDVIFPHESEHRSDVLLVYIHAEDSGQGDHMRDILDGVRTDLERLGKEAADIKLVTLLVPAKLHGYILGSHGTTLNAIIGEEKLVHVTLGHQGDADDSGASDQIVVRGPSEEVARVEKEILRLADEGKHHDAINSYTTEFEVDSLHVGRIVGKGGAGVHQLRDDLGVRIDFSDVAAESATKKKKGKTSVKIKGRKENVEEAKKRILAQSDRFADEVTLRVPLPAEVDRGSLLGKGGKYILRLQESHGVFINVPRAGEELEEGGESAIVIRGPKLGANAAKTELVEVMEYEREHGNSAVLSVSARAVPRILGKAGTQVLKIKEETGITELDVQRGSETSEVTIRGTTRAIAAARKLIAQIVAEVEDDLTLEFDIDPSYHQLLIGKGGAKLREIVQRADERADARAVRFPRAGGSPESGRLVTVRASKAVAEKIKVELLKEVEHLKDRVCWGVQVPRAYHAAIIGRGAAGLKEIQDQYSVAVHPPGWREWASVGEPTNANELIGTDDADLIKLVGSAAGCEAAAVALQSRKPKEQPASAAFSRQVMVPVKHHHFVARQGRFFRELPRGVRVDHGSHKPPSASASRPLPPRQELSVAAARIDAAEQDSPIVGWQVHDLDSGADDTEIAWNVSASSEQDAELVEKAIRDAVAKASEANAVAYCTLARSAMPRAIGRGGSGLANLRSSTGTEVEVLGGRRDADTLTIVGRRDRVETVKDAIEQLLR